VQIGNLVFEGLEDVGVNSVYGGGVACEEARWEGAV